MRRTVLAATAALAVLAAACGGGDSTEAVAAEGEAPSCAGVRDGPVSEEVAALAELTPGGPLPDVELAVLDGSTCQDFADLVGTPLVVNFWATWCAFCVEEMPDLQAASETLAGEVQFVGIDREDVRDKALVLAEETGVDYLLLEDPTADSFRAFEGRGMPTTVLVDADGVIRHRHAGPIDEAQLLDLVAEHLGVTS